MMVYLDSNIVIYLVEHNPVWTSKAMSRVTKILTDGDTIATSGVTKLACLISPIKQASGAELAAYRTWFSAPLVRLLDVTAGAWEAAAEIAARDNFRPLDALHLATAIEHGCGLFLTNDAQLKRCPDIAVEVLS